ncbi:lipopolysaccharide export system permease protein [Deinobacterium chartae]|uniref:Lipopolysaccharide export system permease protein n=1 Tax=Deinobacterium chartae TaxID=521158 RepID=A0A841I168_9DEIO|nr:lipopolysaccharide export system permease protein [Deinobacterium chartae]
MNLRLARYVLRETLPLYLAGVALFLILQTTDLISTAAGVLINQRAPIEVALQLYLARVPVFVQKSLALAVPFALLLALGRMAKDSELKAAFASGVRPAWLVAPLAAFGLLVSALIFVNDSLWLPQSYKLWDVAVARIFRTSPPPQNTTLYTRSEQGRLFYAGSVQQRNGDKTQADLLGVMVRTPDTTYTAQRGLWDARNKTWELYNVWAYRTVGEEPVNTPREVFPHTSRLVAFTPPPEQLTVQQLRDRLNDPQLERGAARSIEFELQRRFADPVSALSFALAAGVLGVLLRNRSWAFVAIIGMIFVYYVVWSATPEFAKLGAMPVWTAAWLPNFLLVAFALSLSRRLT